MHYILEVSRYRNIVYIGDIGVVFSTDINRKFIFNCLLFFKLFLLVSKLYELSQEVLQYNFFLTCSETEARFVFAGFWNCHLWKVQFQLSSTFFSLFFVWSVNYQVALFSHF